MMRPASSQSVNRSGLKVPLEPIEPFTDGKNSKLDKVLYRYPKGMATSYGMDFKPKGPEKAIPIFNMNTYQRKPYPHKLDAKTTKQLDFQKAESPSKKQEDTPMAVVVGERTPGRYQTTYSEQYPCWGKPGYYHFKRNEPRVTSPSLPFRAETTYKKSYERTTTSSGSPSKNAWGDLDFVKSTSHINITRDLQWEKTPSPTKKNEVKMGKIEKPPLVKPPVEKIQTYSFPGQFVTTTAMQNKLTKELGQGNPKGLQASPKKQKNYLVFDPTTQQSKYTNS